MDSTTRRIALLAALTLAVTAAPAGAATVANTDSGLPTLAYDAAPGEANQLTIDLVGGPLDEHSGWLVTDSGAPLTAGAGCEQLSAHEALCNHPPEAWSYEFVQVRLGDGDDVADVPAAYAAGDVSVRGGDGDDRVTSTEAFNYTNLYGEAGRDRLTFDDPPLHEALLADDHFPQIQAFAWGGEGDDRLTGGYDAELSGDGGDDRLDSLNWRPTLVRCGDGADSVRADREGRDEVWADCELVERAALPVP